MRRAWSGRRGWRWPVAASSRGSAAACLERCRCHRDAASGCRRRGGERRPDGRWRSARAHRGGPGRGLRPRDAACGRPCPGWVRTGCCPDAERRDDANLRRVRRAHRERRDAGRAGDRVPGRPSAVPGQPDAGRERRSSPQAAWSTGSRWGRLPHAAPGWPDVVLRELPEPPPGRGPGAVRGRGPERRAAGRGCRLPGGVPQLPARRARSTRPGRPGWAWLRAWGRRDGLLAWTGLPARPARMQPAQMRRVQRTFP